MGWGQWCEAQQCRVLFLGHNSPVEHSRVGEEWLESGPAIKDLRVLVTAAKDEARCAQVGKKAKVTWSGSEIVRPRDQGS